MKQSHKVQLEEISVVCPHCGSKNVAVLFMDDRTSSVECVVCDENVDVTPSVKLMRVA